MRALHDQVMGGDRWTRRIAFAMLHATKKHWNASPEFTPPPSGCAEMLDESVQKTQK
jgi:hypothetical protein